MKTIEPDLSHETAHLLKKLFSENLTSFLNLNEASRRSVDSELRCAYNLWRSAREQFAKDIQQLLMIYEVDDYEEDHSFEPGATVRRSNPALGLEDDQILVETTRDLEGALYRTYREMLDANRGLPESLRLQLCSQSFSILETWNQLQKWADSRRYLRID